MSDYLVSDTVWETVQGTVMGNLYYKQQQQKPLSELFSQNPHND